MFAGIDTISPGFKTIRIHPTIARIGQGLDSAHGSYDSIRGMIESQWKRSADGIELNVTIPANTTATVHVPTTDARIVREGDSVAAQAAGVKYLRSEDGYAVYAVGSGEYSFTAE
ncbi:Bacterial alpha-L-rhamnosidase [Planctomycetes bacterium CA13]|uniref:Bacterial alpha-L-rhamnosidase n=1 Tax=Novipirellula herctigrandis TaxID=2527986 RepID=A0A5C5Z8M0_9BACT|nr:Bacterial alpha-L-rhamnosidase [Planctomycetes bacterium CA13]